MFPSRIWREKPRRYRLEAGKCKKCGEIYLPSRLVCRSCQGKDFETISLSWQGKVLTYTIIHTPPSPFVDEAPYCLAIVETPEGARLTCQIVDIDFEEVKVGMDVDLEFRKIQTDGEKGVLCYGYKAVPAWRPE
ncbi:MAG: Zn-ribbon domain-containing OB-fold protein [Planctomycetota bacterium]|nr:MAG: Zn-ribbon domain-containing OB-fold protein [Planctomycetota bacterium]